MGHRDQCLPTLWHQNSLSWPAQLTLLHTTHAAQTGAFTIALTELHSSSLMSEVVQRYKIFKVCVTRYTGGFILSHCSLEGKFRQLRSLSMSRRILTRKASSRSSSSFSLGRACSSPAWLTWERRGHQSCFGSRTKAGATQGHPHG